MGSEDRTQVIKLDRKHPLNTEPSHWSKILAFKFIYCDLFVPQLMRTGAISASTDYEKIIKVNTYKVLRMCSVYTEHSG